MLVSLKHGGSEHGRSVLRLENMEFINTLEGMGNLLEISFPHFDWEIMTETQVDHCMDV